MTIEQKLEILKQALEDGAHVHFTFFNSIHETPRNKREAYDLSSTYSAFYDFREKEYESKKYKVVRLETEFKNRFEGTIYYV